MPDDSGDMESLPAMWDNWLKMQSELQTVDNAFFDAQPSACNRSTLPNFPSQTWRPNSLPSSNGGILMALGTSNSIQPSPSWPSDTSNYATNKHDLPSICKNNHVNEHLHRTMGGLLAPKNYSPLGTNRMAPASPPPVDRMAPGSPPPLALKARAGEPSPRLKARASSHHKEKTAGAIKNRRASKNKEAKTVLEESIEDGYAWRKYGQKHIKNRMHPRSYFRCAHPNCPVKKQSESSTERPGFLLITTLGEHKHHVPLPQA